MSTQTPTDDRTDDTTTDADAYAGWREEYAAQGVDPDAIATDGGRVDELPAPGDHLRDRESADDAELIVVETNPDTKATDWLIDAIDATVADVNPTYDGAAPVLEAAYVAEIDMSLDRWRSVEELRDAIEEGALQAYAFPADRLETVPGGERR